MLNNLHILHNKKRELKEVNDKLDKACTEIVKKLNSGKLDEDEAEKLEDLMDDILEKRAHLDVSIRYNSMNLNKILRRATKAYTQDNIKELIMYLIKDDNITEKEEYDIDMDTINLIIRQTHNFKFEKIEFIDTDDNMEFMKKASKWCYSRKLLCEKKNQNVYINKENLIFYIYRGIKTIKYNHNQIKFNNEMAYKSNDEDTKKECEEMIEYFGKQNKEELKKLKLYIAILKDVYDIRL